MSNTPDAGTHCHARRRLLLGTAALAALAACGGGGPHSTGAGAPALVITVDPGTLRNLFPWLLQADPATQARAQAVLDDFRTLRLADGDHLAAALPGSSHLLIHNGFHSDFFIEYETAVAGAIEAMRWDR